MLIYRYMYSTIHTKCVAILYILKKLLNMMPPIEMPPVLSKIVVVILLCLFYGPLFACVSTPFALLGHISGFIYLVLL